MSPVARLPHWCVRLAEQLVTADRNLETVLREAYALGPAITTRLKIDDPGPATYPCPVRLPAAYLTADQETRDTTLYAGLIALKVMAARDGDFP
jgi:hypothetical protein